MLESRARPDTYPATSLVRVSHLLLLATPEGMHSSSVFCELLQSGCELFYTASTVLLSFSIHGRHLYDQIIVAETQTLNLMCCASQTWHYSI
eukprot:IDg14241t1